MRRDCVFSTLTEEQQADLFDWLSTDTYEVVRNRIAQPSPDGFGIKTHINSLYRFYEQRQAQIRASDLARLEAAETAGESANAAGQKAHNCFHNAARHAAAHSTYILAHSPLNPAKYRAVLRALHQYDDATLKREFLEISREQLALGRERLQLDRTQFEYNAARAAIALLPELIAIDQMKDLDDEAKIWRVRDRLFGKGSDPGSAPVPDPTPGLPSNGVLPSVKSEPSVVNSDNSQL